MGSVGPVDVAPGVGHWPSASGGTETGVGTSDGPAVESEEALLTVAFRTVALSFFEVRVDVVAGAAEG